SHGGNDARSRRATCRRASVARVGRGGVAANGTGRMAARLANSNCPSLPCGGGVSSGDSHHAGGGDGASRSALPQSPCPAGGLREGGVQESRSRRGKVFSTGFPATQPNRRQRRTTSAALQFGPPARWARGGTDHLWRGSS